MKTINDLDFNVPEEIGNYTRHSAEIAIMISNYISSMEGMNKKSFADLVNKTPSDVTRWLSGNHNFTILTLSLIETRTGMSIINKISSENIKTHLDRGIFKLESEADLKFEINRLKKELKELEEKIKDSFPTVRRKAGTGRRKASDASRNSRVWKISNTQGEVSTHGYYEFGEQVEKHEAMLGIQDVNVLKFGAKEVCKIRSKRNDLFVKVTNLVTNT